MIPPDNSDSGIGRPRTPMPDGSPTPSADTKKMMNRSLTLKTEKQ